jgi:arabinofuranosyltransferase
VSNFERTVTSMTQRPGRATPPARADPVRLLALTAVALLMVAVARTAWVSDDAFITFRTVDHLLAGRGLIWNPDQRVQVYTHPLWMFLLATVTPVAGGPYAAALVLSGISVLGAALLVALGGPAGAVAVAVLAVSKAFTDFATSGLETPLTYLLLAAFLLVLLAPAARAPTTRRLLALAALAGLGMLNRLDTALLFLPPLALAAWGHGRTQGWGRTVGPVAAGLLPVALWECFSLLYYGALFPNTAYAKLGTGIPAADLLRQGVYYLADSLRRDPVTLPAIALGVAVPLVRRGAGRDAKGLAAALGVLLYLAYTVKIGGDFMSGRFLAAPLVAAAVLLARIPLRPKHLPRSALVGAGVVAVVVLGALPPLSPLRSGRGYAEWTLFHGIADERGQYFQSLGLLNGRRGLAEANDTRWASRFKALTDAGRSFMAFPDRTVGGWRMWDLEHREPPLGVVVFNRVGRFGYGVGPRVYVIDDLGLGDPFLARLPAKGVTTGEWRIGHFDRAVPKGYPESILQGRDRLADPAYARLYADVDLATRAPLFAPGRLGAIWRLNTGAYAGLPGPPLEPAEPGAARPPEPASPMSPTPRRPD